MALWVPARLPRVSRRRGLPWQTPGSHWPDPPQPQRPLMPTVLQRRRAGGASRECTSAFMLGAGSLCQLPPAASLRLVSAIRELSGALAGKGLLLAALPTQRLLRQPYLFHSLLSLSNSRLMLVVWAERLAPTSLSQRENWGVSNTH